jgi:hypothetical protein
MFAYELEKTSKSKVRDIVDVSIGFLYFNFLIDEAQENEGKPVNRYYEEWGFVMVDKDVSGVVMNLQNFLLYNTTFMCTNDNRPKVNMTNKVLDEIMEAFYQIMYPFPSIYEKNGYCLKYQNSPFMEEVR